MTPSSWHPTSAITLLAIHVTVLLGGFLAPNSAQLQNRDLPWAPPSKLRFLDSEGRLHLRPFVYRLIRQPANATHYEEDTTHRFPLRLLATGDRYLLFGVLPTDKHFIGVDPPARLFFFGTDGVGRDVFARTLLGGRISLFAGLLAASLALTLGLLLGGLAGYVGGRTDACLMALVNLFLALPWLYLLLAIRAFLPLNLEPSSSFLILVGMIGFLGWAQPARLFRGLILSTRERLFVTAARGLGARHARLISRHLLPQASGLLQTQAAILIPAYILAEVTLSFLGLGISQPLASWGTLLAELQKYHVLVEHPVLLAPIAPLLLTAVSYFHILKSRPSQAVPVKRR